MNKYSRNIKGVSVDVYDVLKAFEVTDPALQHLVKKALATGKRGYKSFEQDLNEILESAKRAVELNKTDAPFAINEIGNVFIADGSIKSSNFNYEKLKSDIEEILEKNVFPLNYKK